MTMTPDLQDALNAQIGTEFSASYSYLSMASYLEAGSWDGFAAWMTLQSDEERTHAIKFYSYLLDRGINVQLPAISAPTSTFASPLDVFEISFAQEKAVTASIHHLYKLAHDNADYATVSFLKWFIDEQVEEEKNVSDMIEKLKRANGNPEAMLLLDRVAGERSAVSERA